MRRYLIFYTILSIFILAGEYYDYRGFQRNGINIITGTKYGKNGYDWFGYDINGYDDYGWSKDGIYEKTKTKYNEDGYDINGFDENGIYSPVWGLRYNEDGYDQYGIDKNGFQKNYIHEITEDFYDPLGFDSRGFDKNGINNITNREYNNIGYDKDGWSENDDDFNYYTGTDYSLLGYDKKGYDMAGFDREGRDKDGFSTKGAPRIKNWFALERLDDFNEPSGDFSLLQKVLSNNISSLMINKNEGKYDIFILFEEEIFNLYQNVKVSIKDSSNKVTILTGICLNEGVTFLNKNDILKFIDLIKKQKKLKISIILDGEKYIFEVDCEGFSEISKKYLK